MGPGRGVLGRGRALFSLRDARAEGGEEMSGVATAIRDRCPICEQLVARNPNGTLRLHLFPGQGSQRYCQGSGSEVRR
jgi:hypothetical protein